MEILIAIFIVACLAVIYYWIFDAKQKEKQELIKEQINGLIESHTNQLKSEGVNVDTVYTYQDIRMAVSYVQENAVQTGYMDKPVFVA